jgi:hypothetical protein
MPLLKLTLLGVLALIIAGVITSVIIGVSDIVPELLWVLLFVAGLGYFMYRYIKLIAEITWGKRYIIWDELSGREGLEKAEEYIAGGLGFSIKTGVINFFLKLLIGVVAIILFFLPFLPVAIAGIAVAMSGTEFSWWMLLGVPYLVVGFLLASAVWFAIQGASKVLTNGIWHYFITESTRNRK